MSSVHSRAYKQFLRRLRQAREDAHLTQLDAAKRLRVYNSFISKCESGERRVDLVEVLRFAKVYGKPVEFFHAGIDV